MELYNTLSRKIEPIHPLEDNKIKMYTCGLTVYNQPQIGNWVAYIYADVLARVLRASGFEIRRVQNITDVGHLVSDDDSGEDKMEKGAKVEGLSAWEVAEKYIAIANKEAYEWLDLLKPDEIIRATDLIRQQIEFAESLEKKGFTYVIPNEGLYFDTSKLNDYGKLAKLDIAGLKAGARVDVKGKKNLTDFALWKFSPEKSKRDMEWESPWGVGFPGWHLECSVIARETLGDEIDIHTGGIDHIPVHHTNEIAQTESLTGKVFVRHWFHNNHMKINGTKMSKSAGNSYTLADLKDKGIDLNAFKLMVLSSHYRTEGNFTWEIVSASQSRYKNWQSALDMTWQTTAQSTADRTKLIAEANNKILTCLQNDLDTPGALKTIDQYVSFIQENDLNPQEAESVRLLFETIESLLGLQFINQDIDEKVKSIIKKRFLARQTGDFAMSDELRNSLQKKGIAVNDSTTGTRWYRM